MSFQKEGRAPITGIVDPKKVQKPVEPAPERKAEEKPAPPPDPAPK